MPTDLAPDTARSESEKRRAEVRQRRVDKARRRDLMLELVVSGLDRAIIARRLGVSLATVRREVDRAIDARKLDAPHRYVTLQVERLNKAICAIDMAIEKGDLAAVEPLLKVAEKLDRYHGVGARAASPPAEAPPRLPSPRAPLALTLDAPNVAENNA